MNALINAPNRHFEPSLLRTNRLFESTDIDDTRERISRVMQPHRLQALGGHGLSHTRRHSHMDFIRVGGIGLGAIDFGQAMRVDVDRMEDYHLVMFCLRGQAQTISNGHAVQASASRAMVCAPGKPFTADLSADCEQFVVRLDRHMVEAHAGANVYFEPGLDLRRMEIQAWLEQVRLLATSTSLLQTAQRHPLIAVEMERLLVQLLLAGQPSSHSIEASAKEDRRSPLPACVKRAEAFIHANADQPLRLADITDAADVPTRTLLSAFQRFKSCSPMQYLQSVRLELAHQRLRQPGNQTVASVALDCGFLHLGRFAQSYRARYGQLPSVTLLAAG